MNNAAYKAKKHLKKRESQYRENAR